MRISPCSKPVSVSQNSVGSLPFIYLLNFLSPSAHDGSRTE